jgi:hypothetical protein
MSSRDHAAPSAVELRLAEYRRRLAQAIAWCGARATADNPRASLRTLEAPPSISDASDLERERAVDRIAIEREQALRRSQATPYRAGARRGGPPGAGRLLLYEPDMNLFDGAAELESRGFFDVDNIPPWDTWVYYVRYGDWRMEGDPPLPGSGAHASAGASYLVSWVPPELVELADAGVSVNPERCIVWASDVDSAFTRRLCAAP